MKKIFFLSLCVFSSNALADWVEYSVRANGDVHFFDSERVQTNNDSIRVWNRIRYKTSVMGAASHQSYLRIDCSTRSETVLQSTFFSDDSWTTPAMATNMKEKPRKAIKKNSATDELAQTLCKG